MTASSPAPFADMLIRYRVASGLTQEALAEKSGLSVRAISNMERGVRNVPRRLTLQLLADALDLTPEERTGFELAARSLAAPSSTGRMSLPAPRSSFVGRQRELSEILALLQRPEARLVTLTGTGGAGKTRLALEAAARASFPDGTFFVPLAAIADPELVAPAIAEGVGSKERGDRPAGATLDDFFGERQTLLVLDNFEQIIAAAGLIADLLAACPGLTVLVTSRERLSLPEEHVYVVTPLALPAERRPVEGDALLRYDAIALFVQRAQAANPALRLTRANARAVVEICRRLEGLPLAIELAAARSRELPPPALLARLADTLSTLRSDRPDAPARHQTLRAALEWSFALLDPGDQQLFTRLGVFVSGCTGEAANTICGDTGQTGDVPAGLESLAAKNLLQRTHGIGGEARYVMLQLVRDYALEKLSASAHAEVTPRKHADYFLDLAEQAQLQGRDADRWVARLDQEHDNLRAALRWSLRHHDLDRATRLGKALWRFWWVHGHLDEGKRWLDEIIAASQDAPADLRATLLGAAGNLASASGDTRRATVYHTAALSLRKKAGDRRGMYASLTNLGIVAVAEEEYRRAADFHQHALEIAREINRSFDIAIALHNLGVAVHNLGDFARAAELQQEALDFFQEHGDPVTTALALLFLGLALLEQGQTGRAAELMTNSARRFADLGFKQQLSYAFQGLSLAAAAQQRHRRAATLEGVAAGIREEVGVAALPISQARYEQHLAAILDELDDLAFAEAWERGRTLPLEEAAAYALGAGDVGLP